MSEYSIQDTTLTGIADAIRAKTGESNPILVSDMAQEISSIPTGGGGNNSFIGTINYLSENYNFNPNELSVNLNSTDSAIGGAGTAVSTNTKFNYTAPWEWCIAYTPKYTTENSNCILGTHAYYDYYSHPSLELHSNYAGCWFGFSVNGWSWELNRNESFSEAMELNQKYLVKMGVNAEGYPYVKIEKVSDGTVLLNFVNSSILNQLAGTHNVAIGSNARENRFDGTGNFDLTKTYYKENGVILWGGTGEPLEYPDAADTTF